MKLSILISQDKVETSQNDLDVSLTLIDNQLKMNWANREIEIILSRFDDYDFNKDNYSNISDIITDCVFTKDVPMGAIKDYLLSTAQGDYIVFLPSNLSLYSVTSLTDFIKTISLNPGHDLFLLPVINPYKNSETNDGFDIFRQDNDIEGKIFAKKYLDHYNIHFLKYMDTDEDIYFVKSVMAYHPQIHKISYASFIRNRPLRTTTAEMNFLGKLISSLAVMALRGENVSQALSKEIIDTAHIIYTQITNYPNTSFVNQIEEILSYYLNIVNKQIQIDYSSVADYQDVNDAESFMDFLTRMLQKGEGRHE